MGRRGHFIDPLPGALPLLEGHTPRRGKNVLGATVSWGNLAHQCNKATSKHRPEHCKRAKWLLMGMLKRWGQEVSKFLGVQDRYRENNQLPICYSFPMIL